MATNPQDRTPAAEGSPTTADGPAPAPAESGPKPAAAESRPKPAPAETGLKPAAAESGRKAARAETGRNAARAASGPKSAGAQTGPKPARAETGPRPARATERRTPPRKRTTPQPPAPAPSTSAREITAQLWDATRTLGRSVVDAVEDGAGQLASYHERLAQTTPLPWVAALARTNADLTRAVTRVYVDSSRKFLRQ